MLTKTLESGSKKLVVTYGFNLEFAKRNNQEPHFSITGVIHERRPSGGFYKEPLTCGCIHDEIVKAWPESEALIRWHLCAPKSGPMHYVANARYWYELHHGISVWASDDERTSPFDAFVSTVVWGAVDGDHEDQLPKLPAYAANARSVEKSAMRKRVGADMEVWCLARLPALIARFHADMTAAGVAWPRVGQ